jgi:hypothetical protein
MTIHLCHEFAAFLDLAHMTFHIRHYVVVVGEFVIMFCWIL